MEDPAREQQVLDAVSVVAAGLNLDPAYVASVFRDQIDATVAVQYSRLAQWKLDPTSAPAGAPDLTSSRAIIDALNREMVTLMADEWDVLHSPACAAELDRARTEVAERYDLDPLYRQAVAFATHDYCR